MIEAQLATAALFKKIVDSIKDVVPEINFDCSDSGISVQAMDSSHVALTALKIPVSGFGHYRCDRSHNFGVSLTSLSKLLRSAGNDPIFFKKEENKDILQLNFKCAGEFKCGAIIPNTWTNMLCPGQCPMPYLCGPFCANTLFLQIREKLSNTKLKLWT